MKGGEEEDNKNAGTRNNVLANQVTSSQAYKQQQATSRPQPT